jgi:hypothetical protein
LRIKKAKEVRDKVFIKLVTLSIQGDKPLITDVIVAPVDIHERHDYLLFVDSPLILGEGIKLDISKDDRAIGAMGIGDDNLEWTIMIKVYDPKNGGSESGWILAKNYPNVKDEIPKNIWNDL